MEPLALAASLNRKTEDDYACDVTSRGPCSVVRKSVLEYVIRILSKAYVMRLFQVHVWFTASQHANTLKPRRLAGSLRSLSRPAVLLSYLSQPSFPARCLRALYLGASAQPYRCTTCTPAKHRPHATLSPHSFCPASPSLSTLKHVRHFLLLYTCSSSSWALTSRVATMENDLFAKSRIMCVFALPSSVVL